MNNKKAIRHSKQKRKSAPTSYWLTARATGLFRSLPLEGTLPLQKNPLCFEAVQAVCRICKSMGESLLTPRMTVQRAMGEAFLLESLTILLFPKYLLSWYAPTGLAVPTAQILLPDHSWNGRGKEAATVAQAQLLHRLPHLYLLHL